MRLRSRVLPMMAGLGSLALLAVSGPASATAGSGPAPATRAASGLPAHPAIGGAMTWSINWDASNGYHFAHGVAPYLRTLP